MKEKGYHAIKKYIISYFSDSSLEMYFKVLVSVMLPEIQGEVSQE